MDTDPDAAEVVPETTSPFAGSTTCAFAFTAVTVPPTAASMARSTAMGVSFASRETDESSMTATVAVSAK
jgi:hypothetical protein